MPDPFTRAEKRAELKRELRARAHVYPRLIASGRVAQATADRQTAILQAILDDYQEPDLFGLDKPEGKA